MTTCIVLVCLAACVALVNSHSTDYKLDPEVVRRYEKNGILPPFQSYHIHVMFIFGNDESINTAMAVRARFVEHFNLSNTANCTGLFHQGRLCMFGNGSAVTIPNCDVIWSVCFLQKSALNQRSIALSYPVSGRYS